MQVFIANIDSISKNPDIYSALLSSKDKTRLSEFQNQTRKLQFILGHLMADKCGAKYTCIAHKDKWVVVVASENPVGIDIENTTVERDFVAAAELMNFARPASLDDFYKSFTESEATYKLGTIPKCTRFMRHGDYLICVCATRSFTLPRLHEFDVKLLLSAE